jgi:hypothetical protein
MLVTAKASKVVLADVLELLGSLKLIKHDKNTGSWFILQSELRKQGVELQDNGTAPQNNGGIWLHFHKSPQACTQPSQEPPWEQ